MSRETVRLRRRLNRPSDRRRFELSRRQHEIGPLVSVYRSYRDTEADLALAREMSADAEGQDRELLNNEIDERRGTTVRRSRTS